MIATLNRDDIEKIAIDFAKKAYPGMSAPLVHSIGVLNHFSNGEIIFDVGISSAFVDDESRPNKVMVRAKIQITDLEIPGAEEYND